MSVNLYASDFADCLLAVKGQLLTIAGFANPNSVRIIADDEDAVPLMTGDRDILLIPGGGPVDRAIADGSGRANTPARRTVECALRTRDNRDQADNDEKWAIQHLKLEHAIVDSLQMFFPELPTALFREPMRLIGFSKPSRRKRRAFSKDQAGVGVSVASFEIDYTLALGQNRQ